MPALKMSERPVLPDVRRHDSIDVLRAGAILLMVQIHFAQNLAADIDAERLVSYLSRALGMIPAPLFTFLAGMSLRVSLSRRSAGAEAAQALALRHIRRGLLLFFAGLVFATLVRMPDRVFAWDILPFIGASLLLLFAARRLSDGALALAAALIAAVSPALRGISGYAAHWPAGDAYEYAFTLSDVAWGFFVNGYFPLFPWLVFPLAGFVAGRVFLSPSGAAPARRSLPAVGLALVALSVVLARAGGPADGSWLGHAGAVRFYPATTPFVLKVLGVILVAFWALHGWLDRRPGAPLPFRAFFCRQSRFSLTTYVIHHLVLIWPLTLAAHLQGRPGPSHVPAALMSTGAALALAAAFVALFSVALGAWDRRGGRLSFEWFLRRLAG